MRAARILLTISFAFYVFQGFAQMVHLSLDWPAHAHSHHVRGGLSFVAVGIAGIVLVRQALDTAWGWWTLLVMAALTTGGWWLTYALVEFGLDWEIRVALPMFSVVAIISLAGLVLSRPRPIA